MGTVECRGDQSEEMRKTMVPTRFTLGSSTFRCVEKFFLLLACLETLEPPGIHPPLRLSVRAYVVKVSSHIFGLSTHSLVACQWRRV
jgi:hypothetical protein